MEDGYSICMNRWALDKDIRLELALLCIVSSLCAKRGYCWATNEYLADILGESARTVQRKLARLIESGYVEVEYDYEGEAIAKRRITVSQMARDDVGARQNCQGGTTKLSGGHDKIVIHNNINKSITNIKDSTTNVVLSETLPRYGNQEINEMFDFWAAHISPITANIKKNRYACKNLLKKFGGEDLQKYVLLASRARDDRFAPMIADFVDLQSNTDRLKVWAMKRVSNDSSNHQMLSVEGE